MSRKARKRVREDPATAAFREGLARVEAHPVFRPLADVAFVIREKDMPYPEEGLATVSSDGTINCHPTRRAEADEWVYCLAHCLLHLGFGHFQQRPRQEPWNIACDLVVARFLNHLKFGRVPDAFVLNELPSTNEQGLYDHFVEHGVEDRFKTLGTAGAGVPDMLFRGEKTDYFTGKPIRWSALLSEGLRAAVASAIRVASGQQEHLGATEYKDSAAQRAKAWFISSYPLLGALASNFRVLEDAQLCQRMDISVAAVNMELKEIYVNPGAALDDGECRFVMAHELLHVGLRHDTRCRGRDPYLWNVACDYVINGWLIEMGVGVMPAVGSLYDPKLKGLSAEAIYDRIATDLRLLRKLATFAGTGRGDILKPSRPDWWAVGNGVGLDDFYRRCLMQGLAYHESEGRTLLPAGLVEEIQALGHPPIPWDVELARWFDGHFAPLEKVRSYARPSRRQSGSPDIPRPRHVPLIGAVESRTFAVVMDSSGSMDRNLLARGLGAIASYSQSRDVERLRLVFCDAVAYDEGYVSPDDLARRAKVRGRGGTALQPAVNLIQSAEDFPRQGPILIITDGYCERLSVQRDHAFLMPSGNRLPFVPRGPVFRMS